MAVDQFGMPIDTVGNPANVPYWYPTAGASMPRDIYGGARPIPNPLFFNSGGGSFGSSFGPTSGSNVGSNFGASSNSDVFSNIFGGGNINFGGGSEGFNPYQYTPVVQDLQRPERAVLPLTPEEEYIRQYQMGLLLGNQPGEEAALAELMRTVGGEYLSPESNPFIRSQIGALGEDVTNFLNNAVNQVLSRAGVGGALGGSRAALMQGEAAGEATRGFSQQVADWLAQNYARERGLQQQAIPGLLTTEQLAQQRAGMAGQLAGVPRGIEQQELNFRLQELLRQQSERLLPLQVGQSALGQLMGQTIPISGAGGSPLAGLGSLISGAGSALGGINSAFPNLFGGLASSIGQGFGNMFGMAPSILGTAQSALGADPYSGLFGGIGDLMFT